MGVMEPKVKEYLEQTAPERPLFPLTPAAIRVLRYGTSFVPPKATGAEDAVCEY
jgi:hypothetical protein